MASVESAVVVLPKQQQQQQPETDKKPVDREKVCPFLLRVFIKVGANFREENFARSTITEDVQIYTWFDASVRELTALIKEVCPEARERNAALNFAFVYPTRRGVMVVRPVARSFSRRKSADDAKTLQELRFEVGDFLAVSVFPEGR
mmetsp:Transcript_28461/g.71482  ORF Transcript_28461/g.71482 Transcript_28461/m.71482 type:complete len:147 (-) Transcript_28461:308-748(-)